MEHEKRAKTYRDLAIKARADAANASDQTIRKHLVQLAEAYDEISRHWEAASQIANG